MIPLDWIGRRWPDGRPDLVLERVGERVDAEHWCAVSRARLEEAHREAMARHAAWAAEEQRHTRGMRPDMDAWGVFDALEQGRV